MEAVVELKGIVKKFPGVIANDHIDLALYPGETHALVGENGAGKSTLMKILYGQYAPDEGEILIDGKDLNEIPIDVIRNNICYISQDNFLFSSSIKNNINLFKDEYSEDEITESTKKAIIYDDIENMQDRN